MYEERLRAAVQHFWRVRTRQGESQGNASGQRDTGNRTQVTGGRHMDAMAELVRDIAVEEGPV